MTVIDLYAGARGWDLAARRLGMDPVGIELDPTACETAQAAGFRTVRADIANICLSAFLREHRLDPVVIGLIASPPCQAFSAAGIGIGRQAINYYLDALSMLAEGRASEAMGYVDTYCKDPRAHHVLEPLRWALDLQPRWICLEQVDPVLPIWEGIAHQLTRVGYSTWTGKLSSEQYGTAQTRSRAILIASRDRQVGRPRPTHQRYVPPKADAGMDSLFDLPARGRIVLPEDQDLLPWVSMADCLGWAPGTLETCQRTAHGARAGEKVRRFTDEPAQTVTGNANRWKLRMGNQANATERGLSEPAPTLLFGHRVNDVVFEPVEYDSRGQRCGHTGNVNRRRAIDEPAPTIAVQSSNDSWFYERPATTIACDDRVAAPGHKSVDRRQMGEAIRITAAQAAALQDFPAGYPFAGSKTKQFQQIGNAIPNLMAEAILREATGCS